MPTKKTTLGLPIRAVDFPDLSVSEARYAPCACLAAHDHEFTYLSLVLRGGFEEWVGSASQSTSSASVVVMPSGITHRERIGSDGARSFTIVLKPSFVSSLARGTHPLRGPSWFHGGSVARVMLRAYREFLLADDEMDFSLSELISQLCGLVSNQRDPADGPRSRCVTAALERLHARGGTEAPLGQLAADLGKDPAYLARAFRRKMGCTMSEYRRRLCVHRAAGLLASTNVPLPCVALEAGFADQSHLCRVFKAEIGLTPQAYRAAVGQR